MPNSRIILSAIAFVSAIMLIWTLVSLGAIAPIELATIGPIKFAYFVLVFVFYVYYWVYFYNRPRGSKTVVDGRTALSASALIVGGTVGYALIDLGILVPWSSVERSGGNFAIFIACTILPLVAWFVIFLKSRHRRAAADQGGSPS